MATQPRGLSPASVADEMAARIREMIITGEIPPGAKIAPKVLEELFSVSHIPIREALRLLEAEQLVVNIPRRGAIAAPVSEDQMNDIYQIRRILEPEIARTATIQMSDADVRRVSKRLEALDRITKTAPATERFVAADRAFHWAILKPGASELAATILERLWRMSERYIRLGMSQIRTPTRTHEQHHEIFAALEARDPDQVRDALAEHLALTQSVLRGLRHDGAVH